VRERENFDIRCCADASSMNLIIRDLRWRLSPRLSAKNSKILCVHSIHSMIFRLYDNLQVFSFSSLSEETHKTNECMTNALVHPYEMSRMRRRILRLSSQKFKSLTLSFAHVAIVVLVHRSSCIAQSYRPTSGSDESFIPLKTHGIAHLHRTTACISPITRTLWTDRKKTHRRLTSAWRLSCAR